MVNESPTPGQPASTPEPASVVGTARTTGTVVAEVITTYGDRTLDVRHLASEPEPAVPAAAWTTIGACAIVLGLGLALASLSAAAPPPIADEIADLAELTAPARGGPGLGLGALLILLGIIPIVVGATGRPVPRDRYIVGEGPDVHLPFPMPPGSQRAGLPLVRALERQIVLGLFPGLTGELRDGPRTLLLADLVAQGRSSYALPPGAHCDAVLGELRVHIEAVDPAAFVPARRPLDRLYLVSNLGAGAILGLTLLLGETGTTAELELEEDALHRDIAVRYLRELPPPPPPPDLPPAPKDRPSVATRPSTPSAATPPSAASPPPAGDPLLAIDAEAIAAKNVPKLNRRGRPVEYDYARTAGFLNDSEFIEGAQKFAAQTQEGLLGYDNEEDRKMWAAVLAAPVIDRPFGGLTLAETERGGGLHDDRPKPAKAPAKTVTIDMYAKKPPPSAEARALARRMVEIDFTSPHVIGELSPESISDELRRHTGELGRCFKQEVGTADRVGTIFLTLKLNGDGTTRKARVAFSGAQLGDIQPCLEKAARAWKFTPSIDRAPVSIAVEASFSARTF